MSKNIILTEAEKRLVGLIWRVAPITSPELVALTDKEMAWKKSTTYTVLKKLCEQADGEMILDMRRDVFYSEFHKALARCNIEDRTPYVCRHTTATALSLGNIAPEVIKEVMRHQKLTTTERYIHRKVDTAPMLDAVNKI